MRAELTVEPWSGDTADLELTLPDARHGSLGLLIVDWGGDARVEYVVPGSPADAAGLQPGDVIEAIDGVLLFGLAEIEHAKALAGPAGSTATLSIERREPLRGWICEPEFQGRCPEEYWDVEVERVVIEEPDVNPHGRHCIY